MRGKQLDPERIAAIIAYAREHGDSKACKRFHIGRTTLFRYRRRRSTDPAVEQAATRVEQKLQADWLTEARAARSVILARVVALAEKSDNLREAAGALKIVSDSALAYEVVIPDGGRAGSGSGMAEPGAASAGAEVGGDAGGAVH